MFAKIFYWRLIRGSSTGQAGRLQTECCSSVLSRSHCLDYFRSEHKLEYNSYFIIVPLVIYLCCASSHPFVNGDLLKTGWFQSYQGYSTPFCPSPVERSSVSGCFCIFCVSSALSSLLCWLGAGCWSTICKMWWGEVQSVYTVQSLHWPGCLARDLQQYNTAKYHTQNRTQTTFKYIYQCYHHISIETSIQHHFTPRLRETPSTNTSDILPNMYLM